MVVGGATVEEAVEVCMVIGGRAVVLVVVVTSLSETATYSPVDLYNVPLQFFPLQLSRHFFPPSASHV